MLGRRREPARLLVIGTLRRSELPKAHPLPRAIGEPVSHRQAIVLPSSDVDAARHLLFDGAMSNLNMFVLSPGAERTEAQDRALLASAGFVVTQIIPTRALMSIIEARPM